MSEAAVRHKHLAYSWVERDGLVLLIRRRADRFLGGAWELPGGTVEPGERPEQAAVRETAEEAGLTVSVTTELSRHDRMDVEGKAMRVHAYTYVVAERGRPDVSLNPEEHDEHVWLPPRQALDLDLMWHVRRTVTAVLARNP